MKTVATLIALSILFPISASAHEGHGAKTAQAASTSPLSEGTVKKVDRAAGKVTLAHGPLVNLGMPAMSMVFRVREAAWIEQMKEGDRIRFLADTVNGTLTIVRFEAAK
ncbi:copper-binding protein [Propionivibrio sp.]|uniref:copper-binding protein n=1 Tax=Propionivibrio sp. TaxID=2212460 RepID=UPI002606F51D|nr:copper-binding protein [Propionivibrio sp.]